ncbi:MAG: HAD hydrolase-like protein, partial [Bacteroidales bacterium]|nr:HAD hydrolase-like protein [Bacteroidales bacterium]
MIKTIIWDWNGTLLNDIDICINSINILLEHRNIENLTKEIYKEIFTFPVKDYYSKAGFDFTKE